MVGQSCYHHWARTPARMPCSRPPAKLPVWAAGAVTPRHAPEPRAPRSTTNQQQQAHARPFATNQALPTAKGTRHTSMVGMPAPGTTLEGAGACSSSVQPPAAHPACCITATQPKLQQQQQAILNCVASTPHAPSTHGRGLQHAAHHIHHPPRAATHRAAAVQNSAVPAPSQVTRSLHLPLVQTPTTAASTHAAAAKKCPRPPLLPPAAVVSGQCGPPRDLAAGYTPSYHPPPLQCTPRLLLLPGVWQQGTQLLLTAGCGGCNCMTLLALLPAAAGGAHLPHPLSVPSALLQLWDPSCLLQSTPAARRHHQCWWRLLQGVKGCVVGPPQHPQHPPLRHCWPYAAPGSLL